MLYLITGPNGGGKSLKSIQLMHELHAQGIAVHAYGYHKLNLPWVHQDLHPRDWQQMPPGSVMFVDEAQKVWRQRRGNKEPPPELQEMEEHRYQGIDIYLISQDPGYLDSHIKGLVSKHWHCIPYGQNTSRVFCFNECQDNPQNMTKRAHAEFTVWKHPRELYSVYESAQFHMAKPKIPWKHRMPKLLLVVAALVIVAAVAALFWTPDKKAVAANVEAGSEGSFFGGIAGKARRTLTPEQYLARIQPRFAEMPWSAPMFDDRKPQADPQVFCIEGGDGLDGNGEFKRASWTCLTEQGTPYRMAAHSAIAIARRGPAYNPFKRPADDGRERTGDDSYGGASTTSHSGALRPAAGTVGTDQQTSYGGFRSMAGPPTPP